MKTPLLFNFSPNRNVTQYRCCISPIFSLQSVNSQLSQIVANQTVITHMDMILPFFILLSNKGSLPYNNMTIHRLPKQRRTNSQPRAPRTIWTPPKKYITHELVKEAALPQFKERCELKMKELKIKPLDNNCKRIYGTRVLDPGETIGSYNARLRSFIRFILSFSNRDYDESLLIFYKKCPRGQVPVIPESIQYFILSQYTKKGEPIVDQDGDYLLDRHGQKVLGTGLWKCPHNCRHFKSALEHVHSNAHGLTADYSEPCDACIRDVENNRFGHNAICRQHQNGPHIRRTGNAAKANIVSDTIRYIESNSDHVANGAKQLLPSDVRDIRAHCLIQDDTYYYGLFVLAILSIDCFLRKMEFSSINAASFISEMFTMVEKYTPMALMMKIEGKKKDLKAKKGESKQIEYTRYLYVWGDDDAPDLDVKRHLLAYLYSINWKGGFLFPSQEEHANPPEDGIFLTTIGHSELYTQLGYIYTHILKRKDKLGTHTFRKTGYC